MSQKASILIIDRSKRDRDRLRRSVQKYLKPEPRFVEAGSISEGLASSERGEFDCVLVSPRASGYVPESLDALSRRDVGSPVPVILVADDMDEVAAVEALQSGAHDIVVGGRFRRAETFRAVRNALETARARRLLDDQRRALERRSDEAATLDWVTELPNRQMFRRELSQTLSRSRGHSAIGVMLVGLDGFKAINSSFGHAVGDELLRMVAGRLRHCLRNADTIARWGGDEFVVLVEGMSRPEDAAFVAQRVMYMLARPFVHRGEELYVSASIGIALHPQDGEDSEMLLKHADAAMYRAKRAGGNNFRVYSSQMNENITDKLAIANRLRSALKRDEFLLYYQPQLDVLDGRVVGLEALLRWKDGPDNFRSPAEFIPVLEETGLIVSVGEWVLRKACTQARAWQYAGLSGLRVAVNLSPRQFRDRQLTKTVAGVLKETGLEPDALQLELTETVLMEDQAQSSRVLSELKQMGSLIALDDFGIGYSSLGFLKMFPVDTLKIDRTFIRDIGEDEDDRAICAAIVNLARALKLHVMAEGVETEEQLQILGEQGCHLIQGFLFARPMPPDQVWHWLTEEAEPSLLRRPAT